MKKEMADKIKDIEEEIIAWGELLSKCKPDSTRLEVRIKNIKRLIRMWETLRSL